MSGRTTLKTYFLTGSTPTEANFADLIDSVLVLSEDLTDSLSITSSVVALTASAGKTLNDSITALTTRVTAIEGADNSFASNYYTKTEVDSQVSGLNSTINALPYAGQITAVTSRVTTLEGRTYAPVVHAHGIGEITGLQDALNLKATVTYVDSIESSINSAIAGLDLGTDSTAEVTSLQSQVASINTTIAGLPTTSDVDAKADTGHNHVIADISDIGTAYYNKVQTDTLLSNVVPKPHTHIEADITNLDKYTTGAVDLKLADHNTRIDNPHSVTKDQLGLDKVENLNVSEIFQSSEAQLLATKVELQATSSGSTAHTGRTDNPHSVTKTQVGLGNVPDVNFQSLLDAHLSASNPHSIDLSYFDVYSESETDARIQFYVDTLRYAFLPTSPTDGAGAIGDMAYDDKGLFFKFGSTDWRQILASKKFNDGSPSSTFEIETPKFEVTTPGGVNLFKVDNTTNTTNVNTSFVSIGGATNISNILNVTGDVSLGNSLNVSNLFQVDKTTNTTSISTTNVSIGGATNIDNTLNVTGAVSLGGSTFNVAGNTTNISSTHVSLGGSTFNVTGDTTNIASTHVSLGGNTLNVNGQVSLASGMTTQGAVSISNTLNVSAHSILSSLRATTAVVDSLDSGSGTIKTTGAIEGGSTTVTSLSAGSGTISTTGTLSTGGATVTSLSAGSGAISTTGTLSTGGATVTSLSAGSGAISTTGTLSTGGATVTSLNAGSGAISTTGSLSTGPATITSLDAHEIWLGGKHGGATNNTIKWIRCAPMDWGGSVNPDTIAAISMGSDSTNQDDGNIDFYTSLNENVNPADVTSNLEHAMRISSLGNVGIGTKSPGNYKLNVNGSINTGAITGTSLTSAGAISGTDLTLSGNLTVNGTTTSIDTTNLNIEDNFILINKNQTGTPAQTLTSGIAVERGTPDNAEIYWDEKTKRWKVNVGGSVKTLAFVEDAYSQ